MSLSKAVPPSAAVAQFYQDVMMGDETMTRVIANHIQYVMQIVENQATQSMPKAALKDSKLWFDYLIQFFTGYPFPFFNYASHKDHNLERSHFQLGVNTDLVEDILGTQAPADARQAFIKALRSNGGKVLETDTEAKHLHYIAIIREYSKASRLRIFYATLDMDIKVIKTLCGGSESVHLKGSMTSTEFEINNELALALYPTLSQLETETASKALAEFVRSWSAKKNQQFQAWLASQRSA